MLVEKFAVRELAAKDEDLVPSTRPRTSGRVLRPRRTWRRELAVARDDTWRSSSAKLGVVRERSRGVIRSRSRARLPTTGSLPGSFADLPLGTGFTPSESLALRRRPPSAARVSMSRRSGHRAWSGRASRGSGLGLLRDWLQDPEPGSNRSRPACLKPPETAIDGWPCAFSSAVLLAWSGKLDPVSFSSSHRAALELGQAP